MAPARHSDARRLVDAVLAETGGRVVLALPLGLGKAHVFANALYDRAAADPSVSLTILTALTLEKPKGASEIERRFIGPVIERLFGDWPDLAYAAGLRDGTLPANVAVHEFFFMAGSWLSVDAAQQNYIPANYTHAGRAVLQRGVNVVGQLVAPGSGGAYSVSCNTDLTVDLLRERAAGRASFIMAGEVNDNLPYMTGEAEIPAGEFAHILDAPETRHRLFAPPKRPVGLRDYAAGLHVARLVPDGGTLQIGIGSMGDALAHMLILRHRRPDVFRDMARRLGGPAVPETHDGPFEAGLYGASEMFVDIFLDLARAGVLKREAEGAILHAAFFLGPGAFYAALRDMDEAERTRFRMTGISYVNALYGDETAKRAARKDARFVNNAMMVTLSGAAVSDGLENGRMVSGVGGQYNFVAQAFALDGARSIITLPAWRADKGRPVSNIRPAYGHATIPHHLRDIVVTEYGAAFLRAATDAEAAAALIAIADSRFQGELAEAAMKAGKLSRAHDLPATPNSPERIAAALTPAREGGDLPDFPFGTDFTREEQRLIPALASLKEARHSWPDLARLAVAGIRARPSREDEACLARMGLARPGTLRERLYRALIAGALAQA